MRGARGVARYTAASLAALVPAARPVAVHAQGNPAVRRVPTGRAWVRVTDAVGHPLAGASVRLTPRADTARAADTVVTTDATGSVEIGGLPPGRYRVSVSHPAIVRAGVEPPPADLVVGTDSLAAGARVTVAPPSLAALAARCGAGQLVDTAASRIVYGTVVDTAGRTPVAGARVTAAWTLFEGGRSVRRTTTDARGMFVVCGVPDVATPTVGVESGDRGLHAPTRPVALGTWRAAFVPLELRPLPVDTTATLAVVGTVIDSVANAPLAGATVQMVDAARPGGRVYQATSDSAGTFTIAELPPGRYMVHFDHPTLADYGFELADHLSELQPGWRQAEMTLAGPSAAQVLARACPQAGDSTGLVLGRLRLTADSTPVIVGRVRASWGGGAQSVAGAVGSDGVFRLCGVPRGARVTLTAEPPPGWQGVPAAVTTAQRGVTVTDLVLRRAPPERAP